MSEDFDLILDKCIDRMNRGASLEACLADYPEYAEQLEPLLRSVIQTNRAYSAMPLDTAKRAARQRLYAAIDERRRQKPSALSRIAAKPLIWIPTIVVIIAILAIYINLAPALSPPGAEPNPKGNFAFLISDDVNAIGDFDSLNVSITKISLQTNGSSERWIEFKPQINEVDLTQLQGDKTQEIWRGNIPSGEYTKVVIQISDVYGKLKATGQTVEIKLPSQKLQISKPFQVTTDAVTSFTFDLTVVATGNSQSGVKYILKPQVDQSGAQQKPRESKGKGQKQQSRLPWLTPEILPAYQLSLLTFLPGFRY